MTPGLVSLPLVGLLGLGLSLSPAAATTVLQCPVRSIPTSPRKAGVAYGPSTNPQSARRTVTLYDVARRALAHRSPRGSPLAPLP